MTSKESQSNLSNLCEEKRVNFHADPNLITFHKATLDSLLKNCLATQTKENAYMLFFLIHMC